MLAVVTGRCGMYLKINGYTSVVYGFDTYERLGYGPGFQGESL